MNTRQAIQSPDETVILSVQFSPSRKRFIAGLSDGCRLFRTDNCLTTYQPGATGSKNPDLDPANAGIGIVSMLDDRYLAFVKGGRNVRGNPNVFTFWDSMAGEAVTSFDLHEPIISLRLSSTYLAVVLLERTVLFEFQELISVVQQSSPSASSELTQPDHVFAPNKVHSLHQTSTNQYGLAVLQSNILALPGQTTGQVQLVPLPHGSKRVFRAHNTQLRAIALSYDGRLVATASVQGTLLRVYDTTTLDQIAEFRRGVDHAIIYSLAINQSNRWVACTSDKGTLHIFDLQPEDHGSETRVSSPTAQQRVPPNVHRKNSSHSTVRSSSQAMSPSLNSAARSSPPASVQYQGSVQEYYGLLPPPPIAGPSSHSTAISALSALKNSSLAPRVLRDVRSVTSASFWLGDERPHWQGGSSHSWTTGPDGIKRRVQMPVQPLANDPSGRPAKGILAFAPGEEDVLYVIGGGSEARWEKFQLIPGNQPAKWILHNHGHRKYMRRQFVD